MKNKGFSLVEVLLVLGFAAVLIAGAFLAYSSVKGSSAVNSEAQALATMVAGTKSLFASSPGYDDISAEVLINAGIVPENHINADRTGIVHHLGGTTQQIRVRTAGNASSDIKSFGFDYRFVPENKCAKFVTAIAPTVDYIAVKGSQIVKARGEPLDVAALTAACANGRSQVYTLID